MEVYKYGNYYICKNCLKDKDFEVEDKIYYGRCDYCMKPQVEAIIQYGRADGIYTGDISFLVIPCDTYTVDEGNDYVYYVKLDGIEFEIEQSIVKWQDCTTTDYMIEIISHTKEIESIIAHKINFINGRIEPINLYHLQDK